MTEAAAGPAGGLAPPAATASTTGRATGGGGDGAPSATASGSTRAIWRLVGADGVARTSAVAGALGGNRRGRLYGRLDCPAALRAIARGGYVARRVFFFDEATAIAAGYRPCAVCMPIRYAAWRAGRRPSTSTVRAAPGPR